MGTIVENGSGFVSSQIHLEPFDVDHRAVVSHATSSGTGGLFLGGYAIYLSPAELTARASGVPGGATVTYNTPSIRVQDLNGNQDYYLAPGSDLELGSDWGYFDREYVPIHVEFSANRPEIAVSADGRTARGSVVPLSMEATFGPADDPLATVRMELQPIEVSASAPTGGVPCRAPRITRPADGSTVQGTTVATSGVATPNALIDLTVDGNGTSGVTVADPDGRWSLDEPLTMTEGRHHAFIRERIDSLMVVSQEITFEVVEPRIEPPTLTAPGEDAVVTEPRPQIAGRAGPGLTVRAWVDDEAVGNDRVDQAGTFSITPRVALVDGRHEVWAETYDDEGNRSGSSAVRSFVVDAGALSPSPSNAPSSSSSPTFSSSPGPSVSSSASSQPGSSTPSHPAGLAESGGPSPGSPVGGLLLIAAGVLVLIGARRRVRGGARRSP